MYLYATSPSIMALIWSLHGSIMVVRLSHFWFIPVLLLFCIIFQKAIFLSLSDFFYCSTVWFFISYVANVLTPYVSSFGRSWSALFENNILFCIGFRIFRQFRRLKFSYRTLYSFFRLGLRVDESNLLKTMRGFCCCCFFVFFSFLGIT